MRSSTAIGWPLFPGAPIPLSPAASLPPGGRAGLQPSLLDLRTATRPLPPTLACTRRPAYPVRSAGKQVLAHPPRQGRPLDPRQLCPEQLLRNFVRKLLDLSGTLTPDQPSTRENSPELFSSISASVSAPFPINRAAIAAFAADTSSEPSWRNAIRPSAGHSDRTARPAVTPLRAKS